MRSSSNEDLEVGLPDINYLREISLILLLL